MSHDHGGGSTGDNSTESEPMMMMHSFFHIGKSETILFKFWKTENIGGILGSVIFIFLLAVAYEGLKFYREYLYKNYYFVPKPNKKSTNKTADFVQVRMLSWMHLWQTILHMVQTNASYWLMLIFMTYNLWICLAIAFGAGLGYFLFGHWRKAPVVDETCNCA